MITAAGGRVVYDNDAYAFLEGTAPTSPEGFIEHAVQENVCVGTPMLRRGRYMYATMVEHGPRGQLGCGLGPTPSTGEIAVLVPTVDVSSTGETHTIDGVEIEFQMAPGAEAPAEMHFFLPKFKALCMAESATHNLHNLLTLRGALVRDPHAWSGHLTEAIDRYADRSDVLFASRHWPTWGTDRIVEFLSLQRDLYAYLHDQTLRLLNQGLTGIEIAEAFELPPPLETAWHARGYYGSVSHNVKAVYQRYMGWFDGNPARLWPHPPEAIGPRYVDAIGGVDRVVAIAQKAFGRGDVRWATTLLDHVIFTDEDYAPARELCASTLQQLAYGAENATWPNFFLSGATALRWGHFRQRCRPVHDLAHACPARGGADVRPDGYQRRRPQGMGSRARRGRFVRRPGRQLPADATQRRSGVSKDAGRPGHRRCVVESRRKVRLMALVMGDLASPGVEIAGDEKRLRSCLVRWTDPTQFHIITP